MKKKHPMIIKNAIRLFFEELCDTRTIRKSFFLNLNGAYFCYTEKTIFFLKVYAMTYLSTQDPLVSGIIQKERERQQNTLSLIASENYVSAAVREATGSCLTNKYAEGYPGKRYYAGCDVI